MNYLIAIDCDGTLRRSDGTISERTKKIIKQISNYGHRIIISTARPRYETLKLCEELGLKDYIISSNGSEIYDTSSNEIVYSNYIDSVYCKELYSLAKKYDVRIIYVNENKEYATKYVRNPYQVKINDDNIDQIDFKKIKQVMLIDSDNKKIKKIQKNIIKNKKVNIIDTSEECHGESWLSIVSNNTSKGFALQKLAGLLNVSDKNIVAIGNDNNDISMLDVANIKVAVRNSNQKVLSFANHIISANDEDGVAEYLEELLK